MENLKIKNTKTNEILKNLNIMGYLWIPESFDADDCLLKSRWIITESNGLIFYSSKDHFMGEEDHKEITLQELRDMVVFKRNNIVDANYVRPRDGKLYFKSHNNRYYYMLDDEWILSTWETRQLEPQLKPIKKQKPMKEYLFKYNDCYTLVKLSKEDAESKPEQYIEVPDGAIALTQNEYRKMHFWKDGDFAFCIGRDSEFYKSACTIGDVIHNEGWSILWQRHKEETGDLMQANGVGVGSGKNHSHYKKDVSHLSVIDPYRIADLYELHPCAEHIMKKSLCAGCRGHKDLLRDIQDIIDTAERWKEMLKEDGHEF